MFNSKKTNPTPDIAFVEAFSDCRHCGNPLPINHFSEKINCSLCHQENEILRGIWHHIVAHAKEVLPGYGKGVGTNKKNGSSNGKVRSFCGRAKVPCSCCDGELVLTSDGKQAKCRKCDFSRSVSPIPDWLKGPTGDLVGFFSDYNDKQSIPKKPKAIGIDCANCGGSLRANGTSRDVVCEFCGASNILEQHVWRLFHPIKTKQTWYLAFLLQNDPRRKVPETSGQLPLPVTYASLLSYLWIGVLIIAALLSSVWVDLYERLTSDAAFFAGHNGAAGSLSRVFILAILTVGALVAFGGRLADKIKWSRQKIYVEEQIRSYRDELNFFSPKNEVLAKYVSYNNSRVEIQLFRPTDLKNPFRTLSQYVSKSVYQRIGQGGFVRAWYNNHTKQVNLTEQPSVLNSIASADLESQGMQSEEIPTAQQLLKPPGFKFQWIFLGATVLLLTLQLLSLNSQYKDYYAQKRAKGLYYGADYLQTLKIVNYRTPVFMDLNRDTVLDPIVFVNTLFESDPSDAQVTRMAAYDGVSGKRLWLSNKLSEFTLDFSEDQNNAIVVNNGIYLTTEDHLLIVLSPYTGQIIRRQKLHPNTYFCEIRGNFIGLEKRNDISEQQKQYQYYNLQTGQLTVQKELSKVCARNFHSSLLEWPNPHYQVVDGSKMADIYFTEGGARRYDIEAKLIDNQTGAMVLFGRDGERDNLVSVYPAATDYQIGAQIVKPYWEKNLSGINPKNMNTRAAITPGRLILLSVKEDRKELSCRALFTGQLLWKTLLEEESHREYLKATSRQIFLNTGNGKMSVFDLVTGKLRTKLGNI